LSKLTAIHKTLIGNIVPEFPGSTYAGLWIKARTEQIDQVFKDLEDDVQRVNAYQEKNDSDPSQNAQDREDETQQCTDRPNPVLTIATICKGRTLFVTEDGRIGVGPDILQKGDEICIFYGAHTPFVVRPIKSVLVNVGNYYQLVGECYVHGLMDGEAMEMEELQAQAISLV
jgi:hypothetical protein